MSDPTTTTPASTTAGNAVTGTAATGQSVSSSTAAGTSTRIATAVGSGTTTVTVTDEEPQQVLRLTLVDRPTVTWDENVVDNEGMGRKSSKRCCIFHKEKAFGESSTDSSDYDSDGDKNQHKRIAHKKHNGKKKTPDHLRFHA